MKNNSLWRVFFKKLQYKQLLPIGEQIEVATLLAIVFDEAKVRHIYFVAETKGGLSSLELRQLEKDKIECARRFFDKLNQALPPLNQSPVTYDVIDSYSKLMELVKPGGERSKDMDIYLPLQVMQSQCKYVFAGCITGETVLLRD